MTARYYNLSSAIIPKVMRLDGYKNDARQHTKVMKKKIFISGGVREYDSNHPEALAHEIEDYIRQNIVREECADQVKVIVSASGPKDVTITMPFSSGVELRNDEISNELYRCFTGECSSFRTKNSLWCGFNFGPAYQINIIHSIEDTISNHKKNTWFYKANRYKSMEMDASINGLKITFHY